MGNDGEGRVDLATAHNPYRFNRPANRDSFSGRANQIRDIRYYLDQAVRAPDPINLALLGPRAAGKTSLLNFIEWEASKRGLCVARVDLNLNSVQSPLIFFAEVFDAILDAACSFVRLDDSGE